MGRLFSEKGEELARRVRALRWAVALRSLPDLPCASRARPGALFARGGLLLPVPLRRRRLRAAEPGALLLPGDAERAQPPGEGLTLGTTPRGGGIPGENPAQSHAAPEDREPDHVRSASSRRDARSGEPRLHATADPLVGGARPRDHGRLPGEAPARHSL